MNAQHWRLYVTRRDSAPHSRDKTGQLCANMHSSSTPPAPRKTHFQASLPGNLPPDPLLPAQHRPPQTQTGLPPLPPSARCDLWLH